MSFHSLAAILENTHSFMFVDLLYMCMGRCSSKPWCFCHIFLISLRLFQGANLKNKRMFNIIHKSKKTSCRQELFRTKPLRVTGTWLVQLAEHVIPDLGVVSSSPMLGVQITETK